MRPSRAAVMWLIAASVPSGVFPLEGEEPDEPHEDGDVDVGDGELPPDQLRRLHTVMDLNKDGKLSLEEVLSYAKHANKQIAAKDVTSILEEIDTSEDGKLSLEEYWADIEQHASDADDEEATQRYHDVASAKFAAADDDGDQLLDAWEISSLFYPETHEEVLSVAVAETMRQKDKDNDGKLTEHEFWEADTSEDADGQLTEEEHSEFMKLDVNGDGTLDVGEIRDWESGKFHTEATMKSLFDRADTDGDMHVSHAEFVAARDEIVSTSANYHFIEWAQHLEL